MKVLFDHISEKQPKASIILLDWSCRESFHVLDYLNKQTVSRQSYEIIWIEYYFRRPAQIADALKSCSKSPIIDQWIILEMPEDAYYHKHLMYNIGIISCRGEIAVICDSDAVVEPCFVENIIKTFEKKSDIVLHLDEVRNTDKRFYPFNYPAVKDIKKQGCINLQGGKTTGLLDIDNPLHTRNYGACMCALRRDLIAIGGADEHTAYLGHICGPYEMTFRLINASKEEIWHQDEFLYHTWHPGTDGKDNYFGPHDGYNMSTVAMKTRSSGRILPLVENPAINTLRTDAGMPMYDSLLWQAVPLVEAVRWKPQNMRRSLRQKIVRCVDVYRNIKKGSWNIGSFLVHISLYCSIIMLAIKQVYIKLTRQWAGGNNLLEKSVPFRIQLFYKFFFRMLKNNIYTAGLCRRAIKTMSLNGTGAFAVYGTGFIAKILLMLVKAAPIKISNVYDETNVGKKFSGFEVCPLQSLDGFDGKIMIASLFGVIEKAARLRRMGIKDENIIKLD